MLPSSAAMKVIAAEVAAHLGMGRKAATESQATTGEMASAKAAAHASAAAEPAAHMTATAEPAPVSISPAAARKRIGGQYPGESDVHQYRCALPVRDSRRNESGCAKARTAINTNMGPI
jgi:hypothetical protein